MQQTVRRHTEPDDQSQWKAAFRRLAPLIDGVEYFAAARSALIGARRQAIIIGWELHSELDLLRGDQAERAVQTDGYPTPLADLLRALVEERQDLEINLLIWEGASLFALEREHLPRMKLPWEKHPRIRLEWDTTAPPMASQHQKLLVIDDARDDNEREAVAALRRRLLAYLLHTEPDRVAQAERELGSVVRAIESLRAGERTLHPFDHTAPAYARAAPLTPEIADPDHPLCHADVQQALRAMARSLGLRQRASGVWNAAIGRLRRHPLLYGAGALATLAAIIALSPLRTLFTEGGVRHAVQAIESGPLGAAGVLAALILLGSIGVPLTLLLTAVGLSLHAWWAFPVAYAGVIGASLPGFAIGRALRPASARSGAGGRARKLLDRFRKHGVLGVAIARSIPAAPFVVFNIACDAARLSWARYTAGTAIGVLPGVALITLFGNEVGALIRDPSPAGLARALAIGAGVVVAALLVGRLMNAPSPRPEDRREPEAG